MDNSGVHPIYQSLVSSGVGFGAQLWVNTLQRQCNWISSLLANSNFGSTATGDEGVMCTRAAKLCYNTFPTFYKVGSCFLPAGLNNEGHHSMLKLAERMTNNFCAGVSASSKHSWITLSGAGAEEFKVVIRESVDDPGRPPGIVLSAATSLRLPVSSARLFHFLCDHRRRTEVPVLLPCAFVRG